MSDDRKAELERLKKELLDREKEEKLQGEIEAIKERLGKKRGTLKAWLQEKGLWRSFILVIFGIVLVEIGVFTGLYYAYGGGVLMIIGGIVFIPWVREFFGDALK